MACQSLKPATFITGYVDEEVTSERNTDEDESSDHEEAERWIGDGRVRVSPSSARCPGGCRVSPWREDSRGDV